MKSFVEGEVRLLVFGKATLEMVQVVWGAFIKTGSPLSQKGVGVHI
jgi:hypothetical protein